MQIIPVIDLLDGVVVHARKGERQHYKAIQSLLTHSSKPLDIVAALLEYFPFQQLYIADLNAIQKFTHTPNNYRIIESIAKLFPELVLWIDAGIHSITELGSWTKLNAKLILGSENFSNIDEYLALKKLLNNQLILSLDYMPQGYMGPEQLIQSTQYWPDDVILMSLSHVGENSGCNTQLLETFKSFTTKYKLYAAGGIRNMEDFKLLQNYGVHGALIATALHQKQLSYNQINQLIV